MCIFIVIVTVFVSRNILPLEMMVKAYIFSTNTQLCPVVHWYGQTSFICYKYDENRIGGNKETLVVDPSDSMLLPPSKWTQEVKGLFCFANIAGMFSDDDCHFRNTRHLVGHIFWVSDDCWRPRQ